MSATTLLSPEETRRRLADAYAPIREELAEVERTFAREVASYFPYVQSLVDRAISFGGKRLRPVLVLTSARACGGICPEHIGLAAAIEMIHTATLVHDDVLDEAVTRRHARTINDEWGLEASVLLGDYLFSHAYHLAACAGSSLACRLIGRATNAVCEGEMIQGHERGNFELDEAAYLAIIRGKTAELTAVACRLGAVFAGADGATADALEGYGRDLGVAFQIADDLLDYLGDESSAGKTLGTDLLKQKLTLPVIRLLAATPEPELGRIKNLLRHPTAEGRLELVVAMEAAGSLVSARRCAEDFARSAVARLDVLPRSEARDVLTALTRHVLRRGV